MRRDFVVAHGGHWHDGAQDAMIGMRTQEWARYIHDGLGVALPPNTIAERVVEGVSERLQDVPVLEGANSALERLSGAYPLALATSASLPVARTVLDRTGWGKFFKAVVSADEVPRGKPAPDVYLRAIELLGAPPSCTAAIEDSSNGIRSAHAAQLAVIAIPNHEFPPDAGALALASRVIPDLDALTVELVREVLPNC